ncbi:CDP-glucose 4,6-dehydratase, partial [Candidatus Magnetoovum chiemensis]
MTHVIGDIRDYKHFKQVFDDFNPHVVFHLAAQAITRLSYEIPQETFYTNIVGTVNALQCIKESKSVKAAVFVTSDKCYQNVEWVWGYRENDSLGGNDPYSASKACAELACHSYVKSFFLFDDSPFIATARAGNVIGGGDWAKDRIIPDCVRAFSKNETLTLRNPKATRPWQHVLEPLSGYLWLCANLLMKNEKVIGEAFNFGPPADVIRAVEEVIKEFSRLWSGGKWIIEKGSENLKEATLLKLNCDKALHCLNWNAVLSFEQTIDMTVKWYQRFYSGEKNMYGFTTSQIDDYSSIAGKKAMLWVGEWVGVKMIDGLIISQLKQIKDERGMVMHMIKEESNLFERFGEIYFSLIKPGAIKAWKQHLKMTQLFAVPVGTIKLVLFDARKASLTYGMIDEIHTGEDNYCLIKIPPLLVYGFKGISHSPALIANLTDMPHNPDESKRISIDS